MHNEVCRENPEIQARFDANPIAVWRAKYREDDGRWPTPEMHLDIYDAIMSGDDCAFKAPRSFAKSTVCNLDVVLYLCCEHDKLKKMKNPPIFPHDEIMLCGANGKKGRKWLIKIRDELENNDRILNAYGELRHRATKRGREDKPWNQDEINLKNGVRVVAVGAGYSLRGERPKLFIGDDLDDDEEARSPEQVEKNIEWYDKAVTNMMDERECQSFIIGTTIEEEILLEHICQKPNWRVVHIGAYDKDEFGEFIEAAGHETWPSKWPHWRLQERQKEIGRRAFSSEFLNIPMPSENPLFEREWFRPYNPNSEEFKEKLNRNPALTAEAIDPAISKKDKADYTAIAAITALGSNPIGFYLRTGGVKQGHWVASRSVTEAARIYHDFDVSKLGVENVAYQEVLAELIEDYMNNMNRNLRVVRLHPDGDKERRASAVAPIVERGVVFYDPDDPMHIKLIDQCVRFKRGKVNVKKDLLDAFVYALGMIHQMTKHAKKSGAKTVLPKGKERSPYTGAII